jgi:Protein of unknown function (DUF1266)
MSPAQVAEMERLAVSGDVEGAQRYAMEISQQMMREAMAAAQARTESYLAHPYSESSSADQIAAGEAMRAAIVSQLVDNRDAFQEAYEAQLSLEDEADSDSDAEAPALTDKQKFGLGLSAILFEINGASHVWLAGGDLVSRPWTKQECETVLEEWWGIETFKDFAEMIPWLVNSGHSAGLSGLQAVLHEHEGVIANALHAIFERAQSTQSEIDVPETLGKLQVAAELAARGITHLTAWDCGRAVAIVRWAYGAGHIDEADAWRTIETVAARVQPAYGSFKEMAEAYEAGRKFWSGQDDESCTEAIESLLSATDGPWQTVAWDVSLV